MQLSATIRLEPVVAVVRFLDRNLRGVSVARPRGDGELCLLKTRNPLGYSARANQPYGFNSTIPTSSQSRSVARGCGMNQWPNCWWVRVI